MTDRKAEIDRRIDAALEHQRAGRMDDAEAAYRSILSDDPDHAETRHFLGLVLHLQGDHPAAVRELTRAVDLAPSIAQFRFNLGIVQTAGGAFADAAATFEQLLHTTDEAPDIINAYAVALRGAGRPQDAERQLLELIAAHPDFFGGHFNLGNLRLADGRLSLAAADYERALALTPGNIEIIRNQAAALQGLGELARARALLCDILKAQPNDAATLNNLANVYRQQGDLDNAEASLEHARRIAPSMADAAYTLGAIKITKNDVAGGRKALAAAATFRPGFTKAEWAGRLALPQIYGSAEERTAAREEWLSGLEAIIADGVPDGAQPLAAAFNAASEILPFALAYQGEDDREPMRKWGTHVSAITARALPDVSSPPAPPARQRKRIGFVSAHFRAHTICNLFRGWIEGADRSAFDIHLISTSGPGDAVTDSLATRADAAHLAPMGISERARHIYALECDALIYPDIGMDPRTQVLASLPLAPRQLMSWGHPVTCGFPTIDTFISSAMMEPDDGAAYYNETLLALPGLSIAYAPPAAPMEPIPHEYLCAQSLFKIMPEQDRAFAAILKETPGRSIAFFAHPIREVTAAFRERLSAALRTHGIDPDVTLEFITPCDRRTFLRHLAGARVVLDSFGWSGGNTSLEALAVMTPVVTLPGRFMRGRHTFAMLKGLGLGDLIADDADDYTDIAVKLMTADVFRDDAVSRIDARSGALFDDRRVIPSFNDLLRSL